MLKIYRILGRKGCITIPYELRKKLGFGYNDLLSFAEQDENTIVVRKEKVCDDCRKEKTAESREVTLQDFLNNLTAEQQRAALIHLSVKWAQKAGGEFECELT